MKSIVFQLLFVLLVQHSSVYSTDMHFEASCNLHEDTTAGFGTQRQVFPELATESWLFATKDEIIKWYKVGKEECENYLQNNADKLMGQHAPFYPDEPIPVKGNNLCRGRTAFYDFSGMLVWPFGPYSECPTYSKCWFGLLTCGKPKDKEMESIARKRQKDEMDKEKFHTKIPDYDRFSIKALNILARIVGAEIVSPEQRLLTLKFGSHPSNVEDDVVIGQYHLTRPYDKTKLEIRLLEFYPNMLLKWSERSKEMDGRHNIQALYLGGTEGRCRPWTKCNFLSTCCGCDEASFVTNTPVQLRVIDGSVNCPNLGVIQTLVNPVNSTGTGTDSIESNTTGMLPAAAVDATKNGTLISSIVRKPLPLCGIRDSTKPGRWIASDLDGFTPRCDHTKTNRLFHGDPKKKIAMTANPRNEILNSGDNFNLSQYKHTDSEWFEASGDPCIVNSDVPEENRRTHYFFAPYTCKYHFYHKFELHKCLLDQDIHHIHVVGDSMSRELFGFLSLYLGIQHITDADLKKLTNEQGNKNVKFSSGKLLLSEGYMWEYNEKVMQISTKPPYPDVYITNYGLAHRKINQPRFEKLWNETEYQFWTKTRPKNVPMPKYRFFQNARQFTGRRNPGWNGNSFMQDAEFLWKNYSSFGFNLLDEQQLSRGRYDFYKPQSDGWHFSGTKRAMEVVIFFNMICNEWYEKQNH